MVRLRWALLLALGGAVAPWAPAASAASGFAPGLEIVSVHDVQEQLIARGYDPGPPNGVVDAATILAILAFERDYGLPQDGTAGPMVQNMLHFLPLQPRPAVLASLTPAAAIARPPAPAPAVVPSAPPSPIALLRQPGTLPISSAPTRSDAVPQSEIPEMAATPTARRVPDRAPSVIVSSPGTEEAAVAKPAPAATAPPLGTAAPATATAANAAPKSATAALLAPILAPGSATELESRGSKTAMVIPQGTLGPLDPHPVAAPRTAVAEAPADGPSPPSPPRAAAAIRDPAPFTGDAEVREAQLDLKRLGFYRGPVDGTMNWEMVGALVKFDASGVAPKTAIADAQHPDSVWLARLKTALAAQAPSP